MIDWFRLFSVVMWSLSPRVIATLVLVATLVVIAIMLRGKR